MRTLARPDVIWRPCVECDVEWPYPKGFQEADEYRCDRCLNRHYNYLHRLLSVREFHVRQAEQIKKAT